VFKVLRKEEGQADVILFKHEELFECQWYMRSLLRNFRETRVGTITYVSPDGADSFHVTDRGRNFRYGIYC